MKYYIDGRVRYYKVHYNKHRGYHGHDYYVLHGLAIAIDDKWCRVTMLDEDSMSVVMFKKKATGRYFKFLGGKAVNERQYLSKIKRFDTRVKVKQAFDVLQGIQEVPYPLPF